jgi:hypothetical protein
LVVTLHSVIDVAVTPVSEAELAVLLLPPSPPELLLVVGLGPPPGPVVSALVGTLLCPGNGVVMPGPVEGLSVGLRTTGALPEVEVADGFTSNGRNEESDSLVPHPDSAPMHTSASAPLKRGDETRTRVR